MTKRFDAAVNLFFDLVERSCAQSRGHGKIQGCSDAFAFRMMQNYDQTLVKLISRQWSKDGRATRWNVEAPMERIRDLRQIYDFRDSGSIRSVRTFRRRQQPSSALFNESMQVLQSIRKKSAETAWTFWVKSISAQLRSWSKKEATFDPTASSVSATTASTLSDIDPITPTSLESKRKYRYIPRDAEVHDFHQQVDMLCAVIENNSETKCEIARTRPSIKS